MKFLRFHPRLVTAIILAQGLVASGGADRNMSALKDEFDSANMKLPTPEFVEFKRLTAAPHITDMNVGRNNIVYTYSDSTQVRYNGGTLSWRYNNPGNIRYSKRARDMGAIGAARGWAVFPDYDTGRRAIEQLLKSDAYCDLTLGAAINKYAPPVENDTESYKRKVRVITGLGMNRVMKDLTYDELDKVVGAICQIEGSRVGQIDTIKTAGDINKIRNAAIAASQQKTI